MIFCKKPYKMAFLSSLMRSKFFSNSLLHSVSKMDKNSK